MEKTDKFNRMIEAFECDFSLAKEGKYEISELDNKVKFKDEKLMSDIDLLEELSYLLRNGKAEIHLVDDVQTNADRIREMSDEELADFLDNNVPDCARLCPDFKAGCSWNCEHHQGKDFLLMWLQSEAE